MKNNLFTGSVVALRENLVLMKNKQYKIKLNLEVEAPSLTLCADFPFFPPDWLLFCSAKSLLEGPLSNDLMLFLDFLDFFDDEPAFFLLSLIRILLIE